MIFLRISRLYLEDPEDDTPTCRTLVWTLGVKKIDGIGRLAGEDVGGSFRLSSGGQKRCLIPRVQSTPLKLRLNDSQTANHQGWNLIERLSVGSRRSATSLSATSGERVAFLTSLPSKVALVGQESDGRTEDVLEVDVGAEVEGAGKRCLREGWSCSHLVLRPHRSYHAQTRLVHHDYDCLEPLI
ncbi:hypothetical protein PM082_015244 [Marasmius tenuissimus]|nr:hypothetical protein PM082_015244 [Marasmius tenuissimus]